MKKLYFLLLPLLAMSCSKYANEVHESTLTVNVDSAIIINTSEIAKAVLNKDKEPLLLGYISGFIAVNNDEFIVTTDTRPLMKFDLHTGDMLSEIGQIGRAANEYSGIFDMWIEQDSLLAAFDFNTKQILHYSTTTGKFVSSSRLSAESASANPFSMLCPTEGGQFIGKLTYQGMPTKELALYDKDYGFVRHIGDRTFNSGTKLGRNFVQYNDEVLYNPLFSREIYNVTQDTITLKYQINFGDKNIDPSKFDTELEFLNQINSSPEKCALIIGNFSESDDYVAFRFIYNRNKYLAIHNKSTSETQCYIFSDSGDSTLADVFVMGNNVVLFYATSDENYIKHISISELK